MRSKNNIDNPDHHRGVGRPKEVEKRKSVTEIVRNKAQKRKRYEVMPCSQGTDKISIYEPVLRRSTRLIAPRDCNYLILLKN